jgi:hypothetical protein
VPEAAHVAVDDDLEEVHVRQVTRRVVRSTVLRETPMSRATRRRESFSTRTL